VRKTVSLLTESRGQAGRNTRRLRSFFLCGSIFSGLFSAGFGLLRHSFERLAFGMDAVSLRAGLPNAFVQGAALFRYLGELQVRPERGFAGYMRPFGDNRNLGQSRGFYLTVSRGNFG